MSQISTRVECSIVMDGDGYSSQVLGNLYLAFPLLSRARETVENVLFLLEALVLFESFL